jgi:hypothetical protein
MSGDETHSADDTGGELDLALRRHRGRSLYVGLRILCLVALIAIAQLLVAPLLEKLDFKPWEKQQQEELRASADTQKKKSDPVPVPAPIGPDDAPVVIGAYVDAGDPCHADTLTVLAQIQSEYAEHVRLEFRSMADEAMKQEATEAGIGCQAGLTINGKSKVTWEVAGEEHTARLDGPVGEHAYSAETVRQVIEYLIEHGDAALGSGPSPPEDKAKAAD